MLNLVTKQDLWWDRHDHVRTHYLHDEYGQLLSAVSGNLGHQRFRHELVCGFRS